MLNNLPIQVTSFIGREQELAELQRLLPATRLLTLTGSGGTGKARLALELAAVVLGEYRDGVWFIELAPLSDPMLVPATVASALGVQQEQGRPLLSTLTDWLREKQLLLILDNCEHLVEACAAFADAVLHAGRETRILASSREALGIAGETAYRVPSLEIPRERPNDQISIEEARRYPAVRLFVERAASASTVFHLTEENAAAVAQVCYRLDGIPLALELAAARVKVLTVAQIAERLDDRFRLLTGGSRTALPRQQTLRALIDWSYNLLSGPEQVLLRRLYVFSGGWTLEAAEEVTKDEPAKDEGGRMKDEIVPLSSSFVSHQTGFILHPSDVFDLLTHLVDKSLVMLEEQADEQRYRFLETIRQFAGDKLTEAGEAAATRERHAAFFLAFVENGTPQWNTREQMAWLKCVEAEHDNFPAAMEWAMELDPQASLRIAVALSPFWVRNAAALEGLEWLCAATTRLEAQATSSKGERSTPVSIATGIVGQAKLQGIGGNYAESRRLAERALEMFRDSDDRAGLALAQVTVALAQSFTGDIEGGAIHEREALAALRAQREFAELAMALTTLAQVAVRIRHEAYTARGYLEEASTLARAAGDEWTAAGAIRGLGSIAALQEDYTSAHAWFETSLGMYRAQGDARLSAIVGSELGYVEWKEGEYAPATELFREAVSAWHEIGNRGGMARCVECLAFLARAPDPQRAAMLLGAADSIRQASAAPMAVDEHPEYERELSEIRSALGGDFDRAWAAGRALSEPEAIALARADGV